MAQWLDKTFLGFDKSIFAFLHELNKGAGGFLNGFCKFVSFFGKAGWFFILLAAIMLLFKRTRKKGLAMAIALVIGAIITNILLKNILNRARPFNRAGEPFAEWWTAAGASFEGSASFPSGHTTAAFASMVAFFIIGNKRYSWAGLIFAALMGFSRIYLIVHYPSDVLAGFIIGTAAGIAGALLCKLIYKKAKGKFGNLLCTFSIIDFCKKLFGKEKQQTNTEEEKSQTKSESEISEE